MTHSLEFLRLWFLELEGDPLLEVFLFSVRESMPVYIWAPSSLVASFLPGSSHHAIEICVRATYGYNYNCLPMSFLLAQSMPRCPKLPPWQRHDPNVLAQQESRAEAILQAGHEASIREQGGACQHSPASAHSSADAHIRQSF